MQVGWFLAPYRLRETGAEPGSAVGTHERYCALDDYTQHVDDWHESEVLGDHAAVAVRGSVEALATLRAEPGLQYLGPHLQQTADRRKVREHLNGLGYYGHEIDTLEFREATLEQTLRFAGQRRLKPKSLDVDRGRTVFEQKLQPVRPLESVLRALLPVGSIYGPSVRFFPSNVTVLDNFNRTAVNPISTAGTAMTWATNQINAAVARSLQIPAGGTQMSSGGATTGNGFSTNTWGPDSEIFITWVTLGTTYIAPFVRLQQAGAAGTFDGYAVLVSIVSGASNDTAILRRYDNATATALGSTITGFDVAANDVWGLDVIGTGAAMLTAVYRKPTGGAWSQLGQRSDSTYTAANTFGFEVGGTADRLDDLSGGTANYGIFRRPQVAYPPMATAVLMGSLGMGGRR